MTTEQFISKIERRSRAESLYWAGVLVWAGLVLGANSLGLLPQFGSGDIWSWVFFGAGLYGTLLNLYHTALADSVTTTWDYIWSGFWLVLGLSGLFIFDMFWPLVLILVGGVTLIKAIGSN